MVMYANEFKTKENQKLAEIQKLTATNIFWKRSDLPFSRKGDRKRRKAWVHLRMIRILFAAKQSWTTLRVSRP